MLKTENSEPGLLKIEQRIRKEILQLREDRMDNFCWRITHSAPH